MCVTNTWTLPSFYSWKRADLWNRPFPMSLFAPCCLNCMKYQRSGRRSLCQTSNLHRQDMARLKKIILYYNILFDNILFFLFYFPSKIISVPSCLFNPSSCDLFVPFIWSLVHHVVYSGGSSWGFPEYSLGTNIYQVIVSQFVTAEQ